MKEYNCEYCGKSYDTPAERARCEIDCSERIKREEDAERYNLLKKDMEAREKKIQDLLNSRNEIATKLDNEIRDEIRRYDNDFNTSFCKIKSDRDFWNMVNSLIW